METRQSPACAPVVTGQAVDHGHGAGRRPRDHRHPHADGGAVAAGLSGAERRRFLGSAGAVLALGW
ncbi:MAG TPA: hypothetical protein VGO87_13755, partial [Acidimicrobiia bacterium]